LYLKKGQIRVSLEREKPAEVEESTCCTSPALVFPSSTVELISKAFDVVHAIEDNDTIRRELSRHSGHE
jgi:hypothetical protein